MKGGRKEFPRCAQSRVWLGRGKIWPEHVHMISRIVTILNAMDRSVILICQGMQAHYTHKTSTRLVP